MSKEAPAETLRGPEVQYTREEVLDAVRGAFSIWEWKLKEKLGANGQGEPLTAEYWEEHGRFLILQAALGCMGGVTFPGRFDEPRETLRVEFPEHQEGQAPNTNRKFVRGEGLAIEDLPKVLDEKIARDTYRREELERYKEILLAASVTYKEAHIGEDPVERRSRVAYEALLISQHPLLASKNPNSEQADIENWYKAEDNLRKRRELKLPPASEESKVNGRMVIFVEGTWVWVATKIRRGAERIREGLEVFAGRFGEGLLEGDGMRGLPPIIPAEEESLVVGRSGIKYVTDGDDFYAITPGEAEMFYRTRRIPEGARRIGIEEARSLPLDLESIEREVRGRGGRRLWPWLLLGAGIALLVAICNNKDNLGRDTEITQIPASADNPDLSDPRGSLSGPALRNVPPSVPNKEPVVLDGPRRSDPKEERTDGQSAGQGVKYEPRSTLPDLGVRPTTPKVPQTPAEEAQPVEEEPAFPTKFTFQKGDSPWRVMENQLRQDVGEDREIDPRDLVALVSALSNVNGGQFRVEERWPNTPTDRRLPGARAIREGAVLAVDGNLQTLYNKIVEKYKS